MLKKRYVALAMLLIFIAGCSGSATTPTANAPPAEQPPANAPAETVAPAPTGVVSAAGTVSVTAPTAPVGATVGATLPSLSVPTTKEKQPTSITDVKTIGEAESKEPQTENTDTATPIPDIGDLFAPPKVVVPVVTQEPTPERNPEPTPVQETKVESPPPLRLVGFVEVEGLKALLSVDGKLNVITIGDSVDGVRILAVQPPTVTLNYGDRDFQIDLFEQPWFHQPEDVLGDAKSIGGKPVRSSNPMNGLPGRGNAGPAIPPLPTTRPDNPRPTNYPGPGKNDSTRTGPVAAPPGSPAKFPAPPANPPPGAPPLPTIAAPPDGIPGLPKLQDRSVDSAKSESGAATKSTATKSRKANDNEHDEEN